MRRAALVFDLDGTIVDSLPDLRAALNEMLRGCVRRELSADEVRRMKTTDAKHSKRIKSHWFRRHRRTHDPMMLVLNISIFNSARIRGRIFTTT